MDRFWSNQSLAGKCSTISHGTGFSGGTSTGGARADPITFARRCGCLLGSQAAGAELDLNGQMG
jgi:hypothetical protein